MPVVMQRQALRPSINQVTKHAEFTQNVFHRQVCRSPCGVAASGPSYSDGEQTVDQPGNQACRILADTVHRQGYCRHACGVTATGPLYSDCVEDCVSPAGEVRGTVVDVLVITQVDQVTKRVEILQTKYIDTEAAVPVVIQ